MSLSGRAVACELGRVPACEAGLACFGERGPDGGGGCSTLAYLGEPFRRFGDPRRGSVPRAPPR